MRGSKEVTVVGAGFAGSVFARCLAESGIKVNVLEKRNHIAGNMYDDTDSRGVRIQRYGPHVFHTNQQLVHRYLCQYCNMADFSLKTKVEIDGILTPSPFNFTTIDQFFPQQAETLKAKLTTMYKDGWASIVDLLNCDDVLIHSFAEFLFEKDYSLYTAKQWGLKPAEIAPNVLKRVPIVFSYRDTFFRDAFESIPAQGYTSLFANLLNHENIQVHIGVDALQHVRAAENKGCVTVDGIVMPVVYTGAIDELFNYRFGRLPYRSLRFEYESYEQTDYQSAAVVVHPALDVAYTRITEYTKLPIQSVGSYTVIAKEFPIPCHGEDDNKRDLYYPVLTDESQARYGKYKAYAKRFTNLILCGRLAEFKYYNMDEVISAALKLYSQCFANGRM